MATQLDDAKIRVIIDSGAAGRGASKERERGAKREKERKERDRDREKKQRKRFTERGVLGAAGRGKSRVGAAAAKVLGFLALVEATEFTGLALGGAAAESGIPGVAGLGEFIQKTVTDIITKNKLEISATLGGFQDTKNFVAAMKAAGVDITSDDAAAFFKTAREVQKAEGYPALVRDVLSAAQTGPVAATAIKGVVQAALQSILPEFAGSSEFNDAVDDRVRKMLEGAKFGAGYPKAHGGR